MTSETIGKHAESLRAEDVFCVKRRSNGDYDIFGIEDRPEDATYKLVIETKQILPHDLDESLVISDDSIPDYLIQSPTRHVHIVVSTNSGTGLSEQFHSKVLKPVLAQLAVNDNDFDTLITKDAQSIAQFAADQLEPSVEHMVILLTGDGGIVELLNGVSAFRRDEQIQIHQPTVAILPLGTGNALFHSLHKHVPRASSPLIQAMRTLLNRGSKAAPLPCFKAELSPGSKIITYKSPDDGSSSGGLREQEEHLSHLYGAIVASYGFHSQLVWESDTPEYRKHGEKRFGLVAQELLKEAHEYQATVEMQAITGDATTGNKATWTRVGEEDRGHAYVLAAMVSNLEKTFTISPGSYPLDRRLQMIHFGAASGKKIMDVMMAAYDNGNHVGMAWGEEGGERPGRVTYEPAAEMRITTQEEDARWRKVCIDGTIVELPVGGSMAVRVEEKTHLRVLVPESVVAGSS